jgi:diacylglycerol kinase (ATP)
MQSHNSRNLLKHTKHIFAAFKYSCQGIADTFKHETAFQQEAAALFILPALAAIAGARLQSIFLIIAGWLAVMLTELLNSAIESLCNLVSPEFNVLIKRAKDAGSAAVLIAILANVCLWIFLFL